MLRDSLRTKHKRPVLKLPTGSGKTLIATSIIRNAVAKGKRVLFVVDAVELIDQTVTAFYGEGLHSIGVIQADHPMTDYSRPIQVASVQTLRRRQCPPFDLAIIDECHSLHEAHRNLIDVNPETPFIGLSATPWAKGLGLWFDDLIQPASIRELTDLGYVARLEAYAPAHPDLSSVKVRAGEYDETQLSRVMRGEKLVADVVSTWKALGRDRPTLCFCVDLAHAEMMRDRFVEASIPAAFIEGKTPAIERKAIRRQLDSGEVRIVCSVGTMIKGVDWKFGTVIDAQPTRSLMRHVQKLGRLRPFDEWETALVLDHSDNILRLGLPIDIHRNTLDTTKKGEKASELEAQVRELPKGCPKCSAVKPAGTKVCPSCGYEAKRSSDMSEGAGSLALVGGEKSGPEKRGPTIEEKREWYAMALGWAQQTGKEPRHASGKFRDRFKHWPDCGPVPPLKPSPEFLSWIRASNIRWAKGKGRKAA